MKNKLYAFLLGFLFVLPTTAQRFSLDDTVWWRGQVVIENDTLNQVLFQYNIETNMLRLKDESSLRTYSSRKVISFHYFDPNQRQRLYFKTLLCALRGYETPIFFQVLHEGPRMAVYLREISNESTWLDLKTLSKNAIECFVQIDEDETLRRFKGTERELYQLLAQEAPNIRKFIGDNRLDVSKLRDLLRVAGYFDTI
jgi:hypothetical protein